MIDFRNNKKYIIVIAVLLVSIGMVVLFSLVDVNLGIFKIASVKTLLDQRVAINDSESKLKQEEATYNTAINNIKTQQTKYNTEKTKYETISDDTVNIINEATTEENYNIEYMWVKLGNYAKSNNLTLVVTEPGGTVTETATTTDAKTTTGTTATNTTATTTTNTATPATGTTTTTPNTTGTTPPSTAGITGTTGTAIPTQATTQALKTQVKGSYIDVSDFIFEVENDKDLRFKLDNISIEYVSGTTIKVNFDVKNLIIKK